MKIAHILLIIFFMILLTACNTQKIPDLQTEFSGTEHHLGINTVCDNALIENELQGESKGKTDLEPPIVIVINQYDTLNEVLVGKDWEYLSYVLDIPLCKKDDDSECKNYELDISSVPISFDADEVRTVVCIWERSVKVGVYTPGGGNAYRLDWLVSMAAWPDGEYLWSMGMKGNDPPETNTGGQDVYGMPPLEQFKALIKNWIAVE